MYGSECGALEKELNVFEEFLEQNVFEMLPGIECQYPGQNSVLYIFRV